METEIAFTADELTLNDNFDSFIRETYTNQYESDNSWYRWEYHNPSIDLEKLSDRVNATYAKNNNQVQILQADGSFLSGQPEALNEINTIFISKRAPGGVATELIIKESTQTIKVIGEYNIRYVLLNDSSEVLRQDDSTYQAKVLLPSASFTIETSQNGASVVGYRLLGGGFGHGVGMSQNGAAAMAKNGFDAQQILEFFYQNCTVEEIY